MTNSLFSRFTPKEPDFFPLLNEMSDVLLVASDLMVECVQHQDHASAIEFYNKIKKQEKRGDELSNSVFDKLNSTFLTPFDREDIHILADKLDDVTDRINSCAKRIVLYNPKQIPATAVDLAKLIKEGAVYINKAVTNLESLKNNSKNVQEYCSALHDIENKADDVYEQFIINLFNEEKDGIEVIKLKEIMYELEKATDAAHQVGKIIKTIIVKYA